MQLRGMDNSNEELQLINEVASLVTELKQDGCPMRQKLISASFRRSKGEAFGEEIEAMAPQKRAETKISGPPCRSIRRTS
jgi:hypothetical protein